MKKSVPFIIVLLGFILLVSFFSVVGSLISISNNGN